jgi:hypothetical protein
MQWLSSISILGWYGNRFLWSLALPIVEKGVQAGGWKVTTAELHKFDEPTINQQSLERHGC